MTDGTDPAEGGWFAGAKPGDVEAAGRAVSEGTAEQPRDWPTLAVDTGAADSVEAYYDRLHEATLRAARREVRRRERADDQQLKHGVRAVDDCRRTANELAERLTEWAGSVSLADETDADAGVPLARALVGGASADDEHEAIRSLARRVVDLADEADALEARIERTAPTVAPNLSALAGPVLAARLVSLAGGLEELARKPSGTVQVLGAEDALFAHLRGHAPSPKHGVIYTHEAVRGTRPEDRGSAARALAGKLSIAARIDHYSGEYRPELAHELEDRIATIRARAQADDDDGGDDDG